MKPLHFEKARDDRTLQDVMNAFEEHCNPKKNEMVARYKFYKNLGRRRIDREICDGF